MMAKSCDVSGGEDVTTQHEMLLVTTVHRCNAVASCYIVIKLLLLLL